MFSKLSTLVFCLFSVSACVEPVVGFPRPDVTDAIAPDAIAPDAIAPDAIAPDAIVTDAIAPDAIAPDAIVTDAIAPDAIAPDAIVTDAIAPDAMTPDAEVPNAEVDGALDADLDGALDAEVPVILLPPVNLRSLTTFALAAGAGLANSNAGGFTIINGDVALSPTTTCMSDGVVCGPVSPTINGTLYANDAEGVAAQAMVDLTAAYEDAMSRPVGVTVNDLTGMVLAPGVYTSDSTMSVAVGGTVTLDGQGDPDAVFIFQIGSSLTVNNNAQILLVNGARAENVFWAVFASSTLGGGVAFQGNVLAGASNSVGTGSAVLGRLLCRIGQITLLANTVTRPPL